ncbi:MAG: FliM/FliN family flagellar motor switch protein, partial [Burkholderiales bacterium]
SNLQRASHEPDQRWPRMLEKQVQSAEVDLVAKLACIKVNLQHITGMKVGDVIPFDLPDSVVADVDGVPIFECRYGTVNGRYAIRVERILAVAHDNSSLGERHV